MPRRVRTPDGVTHEFPDDATDDEIRRALTPPPTANEALAAEPRSMINPAAFGGSGMAPLTMMHTASGTPLSQDPEVAATVGTGMALGAAAPVTAAVAPSLAGAVGLGVGPVGLGAARGVAGLATGESPGRAAVEGVKTGLEIKGAGAILNKLGPVLSARVRHWLGRAFMEGATAAESVAAKAMAPAGGGVGAAAGEEVAAGAEAAAPEAIAAAPPAAPPPVATPVAPPKAAPLPRRVVDGETFEKRPGGGWFRVKTVDNRGTPNEQGLPYKERVYQARRAQLDAVPEPLPPVPVANVPAALETPNLSRRGYSDASNIKLPNETANAGSISTGLAPSEGATTLHVYHLGSGKTARTVIETEGEAFPRSRAEALRSNTSGPIQTPGHVSKEEVLSDYLRDHQASQDFLGVSPETPTSTSAATPATISREEAALQASLAAAAEQRAAGQTVTGRAPGYAPPGTTGQPTTDFSRVGAPTADATAKANALIAKIGQLSDAGKTPVEIAATLTKEDAVPKAYATKMVNATLEAKTPVQTTEPKLKLKGVVPQQGSPAQRARDIHQQVLDGVAGNESSTALAKRLGVKKSEVDAAIEELGLGPDWREQIQRGGLTRAQLAQSKGGNPRLAPKTLGDVAGVKPIKAGQIMDESTGEYRAMSKTERDTHAVLNKYLRPNDKVTVTAVLDKENHPYDIALTAENEDDLVKVLNRIGEGKVESELGVTDMETPVLYLSKADVTDPSSTWFDPSKVKPRGKK